MKTTVKRWLEAGSVDIFLGYRVSDGHALPHGFVRQRLEEVDDLTDSPDRYPLEKFAGHLLALHPELKIGMFARDCTRRAIHVLRIFNQLPSGQIKTLDLNCCPSHPYVTVVQDTGKRLHRLRMTYLPQCLNCGPPHPYLTIAQSTDKRLHSLSVSCSAP